MYCLEESNMVGLDKTWWGPRVWRAFHLLAEQSNRADSLGPWKTVLRLTADAIPCQACRGHFGVALRRLHFPPAPVTADIVWKTIRSFLWSVHGETSSESIPEEALTDMYGGNREMRIQEALDLITEVSTVWKAEPVPTWPAVTVWEKAVHSLAHRLLIYEMPVPPPPPPRGIHRFRR